MAIVVNNMMTEGLSGKVSRIHQFKQIYGNTWLCRNPRRRTSPYSSGELELHKRFGQASRLAHADMEDPIKKAEWAAKAKGTKYKTAYGAAFAYHYVQNEEA